MFVSCVNPVAVLNAEFCMSCSLLMLVEEERRNHIEEAYSRAGLIDALQVAMTILDYDCDIKCKLCLQNNIGDQYHYLAPNDTAYTPWSCHSGLSNCCANYVDTSLSQLWWTD